MTDKTISIYWFLILFIIASAIVFLVSSLYGKPLDVRRMEGLFLEEKLFDCVSQGGIIPAGILTDKGECLINNQNLLEKCSFNFDTEEGYKWNKDQFFISLDFAINGRSSCSAFSGNEALKNNANFHAIDTLRKENLPFCVEREIYAKGKDNNYYSIKGIACVRKTEKNV